MLLLIEYMVEKKMATSQGDAMKRIGFNQANIFNIKSGKNRFTVDQITAACRFTGASSDYVLGLTNVMMRKEGRKGLELLEQAMQTLKSELETVNKIGNKLKSKPSEITESRKSTG